jgi:predicted metal-dependent hydrolase
MNEVLAIDSLKFEVRRSPRRRTLGLTVDRSGELIIHSPSSANQAELIKWVERKLLWVHQKLLCKEGQRGTNRLEMLSGKKGALYFNWRLLQLPIRLVDYVIVHELVHLREHNHTRIFWRTLEQVVPDWKERKEELSLKKVEMQWCTDGYNVKWINQTEVTSDFRHHP